MPVVGFKKSAGKLRSFVFSYAYILQIGTSDYSISFNLKEYFYRKVFLINKIINHLFVLEKFTIISFINKLITLEHRNIICDFIFQDKVSK